MLGTASREHLSARGLGLEGIHSRWSCSLHPNNALVNRILCLVVLKSVVQCLKLSRAVCVGSGWTGFLGPHKEKVDSIALLFELTLM